MSIHNNKYKLISNICHEGAVNSSVYKTYVERADQWFLIQDLNVEEVLPK